VGFRKCKSAPLPPDCGNDLKVKVNFQTWFVIESRECPLGQIGDTTNSANERKCVCDRGYQLIAGGLCEACAEGKVSWQTGTCKDWRGPAKEPHQELKSPAKEPC
jgi:hypothetical protein